MGRQYCLNQAYLKRVKWTIHNDSMSKVIRARARIRLGVCWWRFQQSKCSDTILQNCSGLSSFPGNLNSPIAIKSRAFLKGAFKFIKPTFKPSFKPFKAMVAINNLITIHHLQTFKLQTRFKPDVNYRQFNCIYLW